MTIQGTPITQTKITLTQQTKQIDQTPLIHKSQIETGLSNQSSLTPIPTIFPPSTVLWGTAFGSGNYLCTYTFAKTDDGGYLIGGWDNTSIHLIKININGGTDWYQIYNAPPSTCLAVRAVQQTFTSGIADGYIVTGHVVAGGTAFLLKLNLLGDQVWMQTYTWTGNPSFESYDVKQYPGGGYVVVGDVHLSNGYNVALFRTDSFGNALWGTSFKNSTNNDEFGSKVLIENMIGNIVVFSTGTNNSTFVSTNNFYKCYSSSGTVFSNVYYAASSTASYPGGFIQTQDNGFALVGSQITYPSGGGTAQHNFTLVKLSNIFGLTWVRNYLAVGAEYTSGNYVEEIPGDGFILTGCYGYYSGMTLRNVSLVKVNSSGTLEWIQNNWAFSNYDVPYYVDYTSSGGFVIGGNTNWDQGANRQIFIVKLQ
jgi:hypothetical protein